MHHRLRRAALACAALALGFTALPATAAPRADGATATARPSHGGLSAVIRYTEYGIPHITAEDYRSLGFGNGWAQAADQICVLADGFVTVRGERSRYFGARDAPDGSLSSAGTNLASDLYFTGVRSAGTVEKLLAQDAPRGPSAQVRRLTEGWAAGYNAWLRDHKDEIRDPACAKSPWVRPVTSLDVFRRAFALSVLGGQGAAVDGITEAAPPRADTPRESRPDARQAVRAARRLSGQHTADMGSNAVAFHGSTTANGQGALIGNPHYPWAGGRRFWQSHLTIPGELDVAGGSLLGAVTVSIGHNARVAWSHTVATGTTLNLHELSLDPRDPTVYTVDGRSERMRPRHVTVTGKDGKRVTRTQWWTRYGPVVTEARGMNLPWSRTTAYALADPNAHNLRLADAGLAFGKARGVAQVRKALDRVQGLPWVNTVATDAAGHTLFAQSQVLPRVTDELAERCNTALGRATFPAVGLAVLDGSRGDCVPGTGRGAVQPGIFGPAEMPVLQDAPYVENSNDSAWLANADRPLTGYPRIFGDQDTERSLRTRGALQNVAAMAREGGLTRGDLRAQQFANRVPAGDLAAGDAAEACAALPGGRATTGDGRAVDVSAACEVLRTWDRSMRTDSRGALLFDRFWRKLNNRVPGERLWKVPFDAKDPVGTPRALDTGDPGFGTALAEAVAELRGHGIPLDAPLGEHQYVVRGGKRIPVPGGTEALGVWNKTEPVWDGQHGDYREVRHGSSYIQAVTFSRHGCPVRADTLLTYSQSSDPTSPHHSDQTELYAKGRMVTERFCEKDIRSAPGLRTVRVTQR
ncbi:penicillin acylase family protein [Streptomyces albus]